MTLLEAIIGFIAIVLLVGVLVLARLAVRIGRAADDVALVARSVAELTPVAREFIESGRAELESLRLLTSTTTHVVEDVRAISGQASAATSHLLRGFESEVTDRYRALFAGTRAGFDVLRRLWSGNGSHGSQSVEMDEFDHLHK